MPTARYIDSLKNPRIPGFVWQEPQDDSDAQIYRDILEHGGVTFSNDAKNSLPPHSYTVGLYLNFLHPEILTTGLSRETCKEAFGKIRDDADAGKTLKEGDERSDLFGLKFPVRFVSVSKDYYFDYLDYASWFYRSLLFKAEPLIGHKFPVLQAVWADKNGYYPDDPHCDEMARRMQTLIEVP